MKIDKSNFTLRPFEPTDLDYAAMVKLLNEDRPNHQTTAETLKLNDSNRNPKIMNRRYIGEVATENGKQIVAVGFINKRGWSIKPGKYYINFYMDKKVRYQGFDEQMYNHMISDLADKSSVELKCEVLEDKASWIELLQRKGFQQSMVPKPSSKLDVSSFEFDLFEGYSQKVAASGVEIVSLQELMTLDSNWMQKLYDLGIAIEKENTNEFIPPEIQEYAKMFERPNFWADAWIVAVDGDNYVGTSVLLSNLDCKDLLYVGNTSVLSSHRRRGIATALKIRTITFAQAYGANTIITRNKENSPMYTLNLKLGFKPGLAWLTFEKILR